MFYTPGWGAVLTLTSTLAGVAITQAVNSAVSWRTTRKDRNKLITESVAELIATGNSYVYATSTRTGRIPCRGNWRGRGKDDGKARRWSPWRELFELRADLYEAQLSYGRALAVVRLTCPPKVLQEQ
jgi:hypothetical protein